MSLQLQIKEMPDYLAAKFTGMRNTQEVRRQFKLIAERCKRAHKNKLLLNVAKVHGKISVADRYFFGNETELFLHYKLIKIAVVGRPEQVDPQKFGEIVARNRWVNLRVFTSVADAEKWLLLEPAAFHKPVAGRYQAGSDHSAFPSSH